MPRIAEAAGHEDAVARRASSRSGPSRSTSSASTARTTTRASMGDAGVVERLVDRLVGVADA